MRAGKGRIAEKRESSQSQTTAMRETSDFERMSDD
jgi:hypothetical protein